ncbi:unnamed protein product, partial [Peniophora sp. CBMAI 1063]
KLTMKPLTAEAERDLRNHATRTKLLSLHMVLTILQQHMHVFIVPDAVVWSGSGSRHALVSFIDMTSQYLCPTLSRNMTSPVPQVFELNNEIFCQTVQSLRTKLRQEIGVPFHEIFLPALELRTATYDRKSSYSPDEHHNQTLRLRRRLLHIRFQIQRHPTPLSAPQSSPTSKSQLPPSLTTTALGLPEVPGSGATTEAQLRHQALETLVAVLISLVTWGITAPKEREKAEAERERGGGALRGEHVDGQTQRHVHTRPRTTLHLYTRSQRQYGRRPEPAFRLPGEAQKIDRFMLKFAERYIESDSKTPSANADAAHVLSYSVILLNTDAHNPQIKKTHDKNELIRNNRGINDNADLPVDMLNKIYDEIMTNEIRMKGELEASIMKTPARPWPPRPAGSPAPSRPSAANCSARRTLSSQAPWRTRPRRCPKLWSVPSAARARRSADEVFYPASHFVHVRPMVEAVWLSLLVALSGPLHETDALDVVELCLEGFNDTDRYDARQLHVLNNLVEIKGKNMEATKALLDVAVSEGNNLKGSWHEVPSCVSSLEHMQLITSGVNMPDAREGGLTKALPNEALAHESRSTHITIAADMALCDVSWEENQSSGLSQHPRLFSLQKLVEMSYYNMGRIRLEWSNFYARQVCCHSNPHVGFFALDSPRQVAIRSLEKEELPHFKFQKDFLKPFEFTMNHNSNPEIRDMVLQCLQQMAQARVPTKRITGPAFEIVTRLHKEHFTAIVRYRAFADLTVCVTDFCKVAKYQKISLLAIAMLRGTIPILLATPECGLAPTGGTAAGTGGDDLMIRFWYPVLFSFYDVIINGEVLRLALDSLFSTLKRYGVVFPVEFWDTVTQELLFPTFAVLKSSQDLSRFSTQEDMSVWLSTTMIQALRDLIDLHTFYFEILERFLDGLLDLLCVCICQENDTLARIGTSCLQQLLESNVKKFSAARWDRVASTFVKLFETTTPHQLFDDSLRVDINSTSPEPQDSSQGNDSTILPAPLSPSQEGAPATGKPSLHERRRIFKHLIVKCALQLLLIERTNELLWNEGVYSTIPLQNLLQFMQVLDHSYQFARMFNGDKDLRTKLWRVGFMKHLPNLLKQESSSAATLVHVLSRMYFDPRAEDQAARPQVAERSLPLGLRGFVRFDDRAYNRYLPAIYPVAADLLARDTSLEAKESLRDYFMRVGYAQWIVERPA